MQTRTVINECYIVRERLGEDGFCELWRATSVFNATEFLLRFFKPLPALEEAIPKIRADIMASYAISNPAVTDVVDFEQYEGRYFIASAYAGQKSLRTLFHDGVSFGLEELCRYILELAQGVDAFHNLGIIYRCFNSENALFQIRQGRAEVVQVQKPGYASFLDLLRASDPEDWMESWAYVAPEIKKGIGVPEPRADVYSLGIHLFRFLTGKLPFSEETDFVRNEAASLVHVAKALLRRGVPEALVRISLRALRPDPSRRYPDCVRFIADLRAFTDERRALWLRKGGVDPLAEIETLNRSGARIGASQIVRSLDTADYFRLLSEAPPETAKAPASHSFPFSRFSDPGAVQNLENVEALVRDQGDRAEDAYIAEARKVVLREPWAVAEDIPAVDSSVVTGSEDSEEAPGIVEPSAEVVETSADAGGASLEPGKEPIGPAHEGETGNLVMEAPRPRKRALLSGTAGIAWKGGRMPRGSLVGGLEEALARAGHGRGTFRFVEEPSGEVAAALGRAIIRFRDEALVLDLGAFPEGADATDFLRLLRKPLARAMSGESRKTLRLFGKRLEASGGETVLAAPPLGNALFGLDRPEPDPDFLDTGEGAVLVARSVLGFGRRTRPLMLFCRDGGTIGKSAHRILLELAALSPFAPFCCVVFFTGGREAPEWHVLSKLEG